MSPYERIVLVGEKEFLKELAGVLYPGKGLAWRDDGIVVDCGASGCLVYSIDRAEQIFSTGDRENDVRWNGRWSASVVANDVIACGTRPKGIAFDIGLEEYTSSEIVAWARGVLDVCGRYGMAYEGGNLGTGRNIVGMSWGMTECSNVITRRGAKDGDVLIATALIGTGWALRLWRSEGGNESRLGPLASYQTEPWVDLDAFAAIWKLGAIRCGMDLTDGIVEFGYEVLEQDGLGVAFDPKPSAPPPLRFVFDELQLPYRAGFFEPGYDTPFAHGWVISPASVNVVTAILRRHGIPYTILGTVQKDLKGVYAASSNGRLLSLPRYWDDKMVHRGSMERWKKDIVPLFV
jgi:thiamine monophosphate kinase